MVMAHPFVSEFSEAIWFDKWRCDDAERQFQERKSGCVPAAQSQSEGTKSSLVSEIAKARQQIQNSLKTDAPNNTRRRAVKVAPPSVAQVKPSAKTAPVATGKVAQPRQAPSAGAVDGAVLQRIDAIEKENKELRSVTDELRDMIKALEKKISSMSVSGASAPAAPAAQKNEPESDEDEDEDEDDFELFGDDDDEEDEAAEKLKADRIAAYAAKKSKKPALIAKSNIILDVKPWDDETDMKEMERLVRTVEMDGLLWGAAKLVPVGYGIKKLQICCVVEDDKVGTDDLEESIVAFEDLVQSVDIAAFNKI